jgi:Tol biopolymer transport system component
MSWSPDSRFLATIEGSSIAILDIATGRARTVSMLPELVTIQAVAWSPDGTWIAFSGGRPGTAIDIYLIRPEGGDPVPVLTDRRDKYVTFWLSVP